MKDENPLLRAALTSLQMVAMCLCAFVIANMAIEEAQRTPKPSCVVAK